MPLICFAALCAGIYFKKLISEIDDTVQVVPDGIKERVAGVLVTEPTPYQLATIAYMETVRGLCLP